VIAARAPIALLTDFGLSDGYVAAMKGVLLARLPDAALVDVTHAIPPGDVARAAFVLEQTWPHFPAGTVCLTVIDPGVGTARRPLAVAAAERFFVGPDNGVLTPALAHPGAAARAIEPSRVGAGVLSRTFHGRDLFAPAAAFLAGGGAFERLGAPIADAVLLPAARARRDGETVRGEIVYVDRFGDCITNVHAEDLDSLSDGAARGELVIRAGRGVVVGLVDAYGEVASGEPCAILGSGGRLEIAVRDGHAALTLGVHEGDAVTIEKGRARKR
jgi:hypothetical protein